MLLEIESNKFAFPHKTDEIVKNPKAKRTTLWDHFGIALAEYFGTTTLLCLSCMGGALGIQGVLSSMHTSFTAGLAVTVAIQTFAHISGAHINPAVTLNALIVDQITWRQILNYIIPQLLGSISGAAIFVAVTNSEALEFIGGRGVCVNTINTSITVWQGLAVEIVLSIILNLANCASWDARNSDKTDSVSIKIGLLVTVLNLGGGAYTGASMNPARSFGPAVMSGDFKDHWVYWVGPVAGSLIASIIYKMVYLRKKSK
ncbi:aquaporin AQPAe.a-like isoform X2 [Sitophilus oryzae]|uniref:Aquaporin AQPAe.a-like isoform X2 n=1 Tax=Sitophilus oryzae TaxID=7048 RepID=A0A6J2X1G0_SITOR|nr:aquaporin AQPAe.a-like isoform X2 [Sitophilus oryzae]